MTVQMQERTLFENADWAVLDGGLEHRRTGYFIARDEIAIRRSDGLWSWPLHIAEKSWCAMPPFVEAFSRAASLYGIDLDADLERSFDEARCEIAEWDQASRLHRVDEFTFRNLRFGDAAPISWEPVGGSREASGWSRAALPPDVQFRRKETAQAHAFSLRVSGPLSRRDRVRATGWRATRRIRRAGTRIVRLLRAAWNIRRAYSAG